MKFRAADNDDAEILVSLFSESSGGTWPAMWKALARTGESAAHAGMRYLQDRTHDLSVENTVIAEFNQERLGAMASYPEIADSPKPSDAMGDTTDNASIPPELAAALEPYGQLRDANSLFIAELCCLAQARGQGLGTKFLDYAKDQAASLALPRVSLRVFAENVGAVRLYQRAGFTTVAERTVVPHPAIKAKGSVLLMSCPVESR